MSTAQHAQRILEAWNGADPEKFETELASALHCCQRKRGGNMLEIEQQELLESVVLRLRASNQERENKKPQSSAHSVRAGFTLLQHLSHRAAA